jgi:hypothetical protein
MTTIDELEEGVSVEIDSEPLSGRSLEVVDVSEGNIGLTTIVAVGLSDGSEAFLLKGAAHSATCDLVRLNEDEALPPVDVSDIEVVS